jgi:Ca-activated chloride channel family protein
VPWLRAFALGLIAWGLATLIGLDGGAYVQGKIEDKRNLLVVLDVSPSMHLVDAGPTGRISRARRANEIMFEMICRLDLTTVKASIVAVYNGAKPVVIDCTDPEVVENIFSDLPLEQAFTVGKTTLAHGIKAAAKIAQDKPLQSTTLFVVTDGDTVPFSGIRSMPPSVANTFVVGIGDRKIGRYIDGHQSKQTATVLRDLARRLDGTYFDCNTKKIPAETYAHLTSVPPRETVNMHNCAMTAAAAGSLTVILLPLLLAAAGSGHHMRPPVMAMGGQSRA